MTENKEKKDKRDELVDRLVAYLEETCTVHPDEGFLTLKEWGADGCIYTITVEVQAPRISLEVRLNRRLKALKKGRKNNG